METAVFQVSLFTCLQPTVGSFNTNIRMKYAQCKHAGVKYFLQFSTITNFVNNPWRIFPSIDCLGMIHIWRPWKLSNFQDPSHPLSKYVQNSSISNKPPSISLNDNQSIKKNIIQRWLLYVIRSFLPVGFCFHYHLIILVWFSIDFFPSSWSHHRPQNCF